MNRKITCVSILAVLMLVTISYATGVNTTDIEKKESPLYRLRTKRAISEKITNIIENIKTKFFLERKFFLPFHGLFNINNRDDDFYTQAYECTYAGYPGCDKYYTGGSKYCLATFIFGC